MKCILLYQRHYYYPARMKYSLEIGLKLFLFSKKLTTLKISSVPFNKMAIEKFQPIFPHLVGSLSPFAQSNSKQKRPRSLEKLN